MYTLHLYIFEKAEIPTSDLEEFSSRLAFYNISLSEYRESLTEEIAYNGVNTLTGNSFRRQVPNDTTSSPTKIPRLE